MVEGRTILSWLGHDIHQCLQREIHGRLPLGRLI